MLRLTIKLRTNTGSYVPWKWPAVLRRRRPYKSEQPISTVEIASGSEKEPGRQPRTRARASGKPTNDAAPAAERKVGSLA